MVKNFYHPNMEALMKNSAVRIPNATCPPLTQGDILTLRGEPMVKLFKPNHERNWDIGLA